MRYSPATISIGINTHRSTYIVSAVIRIPLRILSTLSRIANVYNSSMDNPSKSIINRANQLNPNNLAFWKSRGFSSRPSNWNWRGKYKYIHL